MWKRYRYSFLLLIAIIFAGCSSAENARQGNVSSERPSTTPAPKQTPAVYSKDLAELRSSFNQDKGKVRLVILLSPT